MNPEHASRGLRALLLLVCVLLLGTATATAEDVPIAIRNIMLLDPSIGTARGPATVLLEGDRIVALGTGTDIEIPASVIEIDGTGRFLMPGMWDLHTHLEQMGNANSPPLLVTQGVTGARELGAVPAEIEALEERIESGDLLGPRIVSAGPTLNGGEFGPHHRLIDTPEAARQVVPELKAAGVDFLKIHNQTSREVYFALLEAAAEADLTVVGHIPVSVTPLEACASGQASIEHIATLFEGTYMAGFEGELAAFTAMPQWLETEGPELADCFAEHEVMFVPTLRTYEFRAHRATEFDNPNPHRRYLGTGPGVWPDGFEPSATDRNPMVIRFRQSLVDAGVTFVRLLHERGAPIGAGTDLGSALIPGFDLHNEIRLIQTAGLTPAEAIHTATRGPGARAGGDPLQGQLVAGAPADLVLLRANPFESLDALGEIEAVILRGKLLDRTRLDDVLSSLGK